MKKQYADGWARDTETNVRTRDLGDGWEARFPNATEYDGIHEHEPEGEKDGGGGGLVLGVLLLLVGGLMSLFSRGDE